MSKLLYLLLILLTFSNVYSQKDIKMVEVQAGTFTMGLKSKEFVDEKPAHEVKLNAFYISQYEILFDDYEAFCKTAGLTHPNGTAGFPATNITWERAVMFCNWLSTRDGFQKAYEIDRNDEKAIFNVKCDFTSNGYRLPTEAEWEYAAKGGHRSKGYNFSGSNSPYNVAWFNENYKGVEHKPGELTPNELGIYDMSGNVAEWCWDYYAEDYYSKSEAENPTGSKAIFDRIYRGGSRRDKMIYINTLRRSFKNQKEKDLYIGIRVVRTKTD